jgi:hypothetical protein
MLEPNRGSIHSTCGGAFSARSPSPQGHPQIAKSDPESPFQPFRIRAFFATLSGPDFSAAPTFKFVDESIY